MVNIIKLAQAGSVKKYKGLTKTFGTLIVISERSLKLIDSTITDGISFDRLGEAEVKATNWLALILHSVIYTFTVILFASLFGLDLSPWGILLVLAVEYYEVR